MGGTGGLANVPFLDFDDHAQLATSCGVKSDYLDSQTKFLNDSGHISYWGNSSTCIPGREVLQRTVYISPFWMINVMKGLMRHERQALIDFFISKRDKMLDRTNLLNIFGILHEDLLPYFWPAQRRSQEYWSFVRTKGKRESELWDQDIISNEHELLRALELLKEFDLIAQVGSNFVVPGVMPPSKIRRMPSRKTLQCPFWTEFRYRFLPPGAFETILVRLIQQFQQALNFTSVSASFFDDLGPWESGTTLYVRERCN